MTKPFTEYIATDLKIDQDVGAVIVAMDVDVSFAKLIKATTYLTNPKVDFYGTAADENFPTPYAMIPVDGSFIAFLERATGRSATTFGKPSSLMIESLVKSGKIDPKRSLMVGDRLVGHFLFKVFSFFDFALLLKLQHRRSIWKKLWI